METLETLETYTDIALSLIYKFGQAWMQDDEYLSVIINNLVKSDIQYKDNRNTLLKTYRFRGWLYSLKTIYTMRKKRRIETSSDELHNDMRCSVPSVLDTIINYETNNDKEILLEQLINNEILTKKERQYLYLIYKVGLSRKEIAETHGISRSAVNFTEQKAIKKLRNIYADKTYK